jgi:beta-phosphoglucomutase-like phosphatase (HAD superfamily)
MDGLLLDSEDKYTIATNEVLREFGKPDLPWHIKAQMQGRPAPFVCVGLRRWDFKTANSLKVW